MKRQGQPERHEQLIAVRAGAPAGRASDRAYRQLLGMVLDLELAPGALVREQELADRLRLGRMPVREAIARLATDGLFEVLPRRGAFVCPITVQKALEIFEAREVMECGIARVCAQRASDQEIRDLGVLIHRVERDRASGSRKPFVRDDHAVHLELLKIVGNSLLTDATSRLLLQNVRFWNWYFESRPPTSATMASHLDLLRAIEDHRPDDAFEAMHVHIERSRELVGALFGVGPAHSPVALPLADTEPSAATREGDQ